MYVHSTGRVRLPLEFRLQDHRFVPARKLQPYASACLLMNERRVDMDRSTDPLALSDRRRELASHPLVP